MVNATEVSSSPASVRRRDRISAAGGGGPEPRRSPVLVHQKGHLVHNVYIIYSMLRRFNRFVKLRYFIIKDCMVPVDGNSTIDTVYLSVINYF